LADESNPELDRYANALDDIGEAASNTVTSISYMDLSTLDAVESQGSLMHTVLAAAAAMEEQKLSTDELTLAEQELQLATENSTLSLLSMSETLKDASSAQIAQAAIMGLKEQLDAGKITFDEYRTAVEETQLSFGLATPESVALAAGIQKLNEDLAAGKIDADHYSEALAALKLKIEQIPDKTVNIDVNVRRHGFGGSMGESGSDTVEAMAAEIGQTVPGTSMGAEGPQYASGTLYAKGGISLVGEQGPELVDLPRGSRVYNASETAQMASRTGLGGKLRESFTGFNVGSGMRFAENPSPAVQSSQTKTTGGGDGDTHITVIVQGNVFDDRMAQTIADKIARVQYRRGARSYA
jgi:hypothetical protein